jgi:ABC-2 type transport system permease protein
MVRAFRSELLKLRRWSVLAGGGVMIVASAFIAYLTFHQITSGATGPELTPLIQAFPTTGGLITIVGQARSLIIAIALIIVTANIAAEWSQGTLRNLLVCEPDRLRWLSGKMLALLLFMTISAALTLLISAAFIIAAARSQGISTATWISSEGIRTDLLFFGNEVLCLVGISLLGMLIAVLTRSTGAAVGITLAYVLVPEGLIAMVWRDGAEWLPVRVFNYLPGSIVPAAVGPTPPQGYTAAKI